MDAIIDYQHQRRCRRRASRDWWSHNQLFRAIAADLVERLALLKPDWQVAVDIGCHGGEVAQALARTTTEQEDLRTIIAMDPELSLATQAASISTAQRHLTLVADYQSVPLKSKIADVVVSNFYCHWLNEPQVVLADIGRILKPDGLMLMSLAGVGTLGMLRHALVEAESHIVGGLRPRLIPLSDTRMVGSLAQYTGLNEPVVDHYTIDLTYPCLTSLLHNLRAMAQTNAHRDRPRHATRRALFLEVERRYPKQNDMLLAQFDIVTLTAWAPTVRADQS